MSAVPPPVPDVPQLGDLVDTALLSDAIVSGLVSVRTEGPLRILNYTPRAIYERAWSRATRHNFGSFAELLDHVSSSQEAALEGYVVRFDTGHDRPHVRLKLKFPGYVATHRVLTGLTALRVWEIVAVADAIRRGLDRRVAATRLRLAPDVVDTLFDRAPDPVSSVRTDLPEEFWPWYDACAAEFRAAAERLIGRYEALVDQARRTSSPGDDRQFAEAVMRLSSEADLPSGPMFAIARGRADAYPSIWLQLRPHGTGDTPRWPPGPAPQPRGQVSW